MFDIAWSEMVVIGAVAFIAIGPKDLPKALRAVGAMTAKARRMAAEFQDHFREAMREAELESVRQEVANINQDLRRDERPAKRVQFDRLAIAERVGTGGPAGAGTPESGHGSPRRPARARAPPRLRRARPSREGRNPSIPIP